MYQQIFPTLAHYTSKEAVEDILFNKRLRFTDVQTLDDKNEGKEIDIIYQEELDDLFQSQMIHTWFYEQCNGLKSTYDCPFFFISGELTDDPRNVYIACFTKSLDDEKMWVDKETGKNRDCCIHIDTNNFVNLSIKESFDFKLSPIEVVYDENEKHKIVRGAIMSLYCHPLVQETHNCTIYMIDTLASLRMMFKSPRYEYEHEIRFTIKIPKDFEGSENISNVIKTPTKRYVNVNINTDCIIKILERGQR